MGNLNSKPSSPDNSSTKMILKNIKEGATTVRNVAINVFTGGLAYQLDRNSRRKKYRVERERKENKGTEMSDISTSASTSTTAPRFGSRS